MTRQMVVCNFVPILQAFTGMLGAVQANLEAAKWALGLTHELPWDGCAWAPSNDCQGEEMAWRPDRRLAPNDTKTSSPELDGVLDGFETSL
mmetsp:Transcript_154960/g.268495  ORF Transcript_154960/g.268495 Transcript_154960/m.268495 type:complete len:91 (+) Transcript_154960:2-274(+)